MKAFKSLVFLSVAAITVAFAAVPQMARAQAPEAEWTWMIYMDSDNNLEAPQMQDLEEMMAAGSTANVNIVVLCDRSAKDDEDGGYVRRAVGGIKAWSTAKLMVVEKGKLRELADWGEVNMGDPATLERFLETVGKEFPAKHRALTFGDHGAGWVGIVSDESAGGDSLDTAELQAALKQAIPVTGRLDLIGFDACMMANFETAKAVAPFAKIMVGSEELEPGDGWDYTPLMGSLIKEPEMDGAALGRRVVDTYKNFYLSPKEGNRDKTITLSEIDLDKVAQLETAVSGLGVRNSIFMKADGRNTWIKTARARSNTEEYGVEGDDHSSSYYDLVNYAENLKLVQPDPETAKAADAVIAAARAAILYKVNGPARPNANGLTIYFPPDHETSNADYQATPFSKSGKWLPFIVDYISVEGGDSAPPELDQPEESSPEEAPGKTITVTATVKADDIDEATFVLAEKEGDQEVIIGAIPTEPDEKGVLKEEWDGTWFSIGDGERETICPISDFQQIDEGKDEYLAEVPAQIRYKNSQTWHEVTLYFLVTFKGDDATGEFLYAFEIKGKRAREVDIDAGDSIRPVYLTNAQDGEWNTIASDDEADILKVSADDNIAIGMSRVPAGKYKIGFTVTDFAGNTAEKFVDVTVDK